jgi:hypothetical protein
MQVRQEVSAGDGMNATPSALVTLVALCAVQGALQRGPAWLLHTQGPLLLAPAGRPQCQSAKLDCRHAGVTTARASSSTGLVNKQDGKQQPPVPQRCCRSKAAEAQDKHFAAQGCAAVVWAVCRAQARPAAQQPQPQTRCPDLTGASAAQQPAAAECVEGLREGRRLAAAPAYESERLTAALCCE